MSKLACLGRVVSVLGAMLSPSIGGAQSPPLQELDAVAMIRVFAPSTGQTRKEGSGILLGADGFVLTARHVVGDVDRATERITVTFISASGNPIEAEFRDCAAGDSDVCLLKIPASAVRAAGVTAFPRLNCRRLEVNDMVLAVGWPNPANMELDRVSGTITGGLATGVLYPTSATALPGMSGGPVYDQTDTVVGLVKGGLEPTQTRVLLVPLFSVRDLIEQTPEDCPTILTEKEERIGPVRIQPGATRNFSLHLERDGPVDITVQSIVPDWSETDSRDETPELFLTICSAEEGASCPSGGQIANNDSRRRILRPGPATVKFFNFGENPPLTFEATIQYPG